jgi:hypothetical protein
MLRTGLLLTRARRTEVQAFTTARVVRFFALRPNFIDSVEKIRFSKSVVFYRAARFCRH